MDVFLENLLQNKFWNHFHAEIIPWSPMFLDFLTTFHMVWKNQQSFESWLVWLWVSRHLKTPKIKPTIFLFLSCHYGFTNYFEILNFLFLISCQEEFQPVKYYLSRISTSKIWSSKNCKIQFFSLFDWFFKNFAFETYGILKMFLFSAQNNFYITLSSYVEGHMKKSSNLSFMSLVCFQASKVWMFFWKNFEITFRQK